MGQQTLAAVTRATGVLNGRGAGRVRKRPAVSPRPIGGSPGTARVIPIPGSRALARSAAHQPWQAPPSERRPTESEDGTRPSNGSRPASRDQTTRALLRDYHEGGNLRARERVIQKYLPLVKSLARRYAKRGEQYEDLVQVGVIGLIKAVDRFELQRDVDLAAFAIPNISGEIMRHLRDRGWPIKVPRRLQELRPGLRACEAELASQLQRPATIAEISQRSGIEEAEVAAALATDRLHAPVSLSSSMSREPGKVRREVDGALEEGGYELAEQRAVLAAGLRILDQSERRVVHLQFFKGLSQPQIARQVGISRIDVSRLTRRALAKMRAEIGAA